MHAYKNDTQVYYFVFVNISTGEEIFLFIAAIVCSLLEFYAFIAIHLPLACKLGIKSEAGAIKLCKEKKLLTRLMSGVTFHYYQRKNEITDPGRLNLVQVKYSTLSLSILYLN